ncbi:IclR family transcriptional regulator [Nocardia sp. NPDC052112]|uniref:IclR family transcriptional regulator n=1 Tax=Nocardia sp. NPDC052112 TaxID=3155646 RepID=UPI003443AE5A
MASVVNDNAVATSDRHEAPPSMVERMTLIMDSFGGPQIRLSLEDVAGRTNLPRSTTHRILEQLVRLRWLERNGRDYGLGQRALGFGGREEGHDALRTAAFPLLHNLSVRTEMVVHLAVLDGAEAYYLDKFGGKAAVQVPSVVGGRVPAHCTAVGKSMLAWLSPEQIDDLYRDVLTKRTAHSIGDLEVLHQELIRIRARRGLAFERGECFQHIACVGAAVRGPKGPVGGISLVGDVRAPLERLAPLVANTAQAISEKLMGDTARKHSARFETVVVRDEPQSPALTETVGRILALGERGEWF